LLDIAKQSQEVYLQYVKIIIKELKE
jgi:hypothetical protein